MSSFREVSGFDLLERIELRGEDSHSWVAIVAAGEMASDAVEIFATEIESQSEDNKPVRILSIEGLLPSDIRDRSQSPEDDTLILMGFEGRTKDFWGNLDVNRSALERSGTLYFWLSPTALSDICLHAPNIKSYIGSSIFTCTGLKGALTPEARDQRLRDLAEKFQMHDETVVERAKAGKLEPEPEFIEWLLLLGRGDLV